MTKFPELQKLIEYWKTCKDGDCIFPDFKSTPNAAQVKEFATLLERAIKNV